MVAQVGYSVAGRSGGRVTLCVVCTMHKETRSAGFSVVHQNQGLRFVSGLTSKSLGWFVSGLVSKQLGWFVSGSASKPLGRFVTGLASKPLGWFVSGLASKPLGQFLPVCPQNWW
jgi:hypothetical protein